MRHAGAVLLALGQSRHVPEARARRLGEDPPLELDRREQLAVREQELGPTHEENTAVAHGEMEAIQDPGLRLAGEVHERVPAHQEIDSRDRRVLDEVVPAEDDRATDVLVEEIPIVDALEVSRAQLRGDVLDLLGRVGRVARLDQRVLVDVGGIDLHPSTERLDAELLGQDHGEGVRLLPGGAAGAPDPDGAVRAPTGEDARDDLRRQELPGLGIPEEARDVDEDGVEQELELLGMRLEIAPVLLVRRAAHGLQALLDAAHEARGLVGAEVEAAGGLQVVEERLDALVIRAHRPLPSPPG